MDVGFNPNPTSDGQPILFKVVAEEEENPINQTVQKVFSNYSKLMEVKLKHSAVLLDLEQQKQLFDRSWVICCFQNRMDGDGRCSTWEGTNGLIVSLVGATGYLIVFGGTLGNNSPLVYVGAAVMLFALSWGIGSRIAPVLPSIEQQIETFEKISHELPFIRRKARNLDQLAQMINNMADFHEEYSTFLKSSKYEDVQHLFTYLKKVLNEDHGDVKKIIDLKFKTLAPMFLMDKICQIQKKSTLARSWTVIKESTKLWGEKEDCALWEKVNMKNPSAEDYVLFSKEVNESAYKDPADWCTQFDEKLGICINQITEQVDEDDM